MRVLADTSVLVAAHLPAHTAFPVASAWLNRAKLGAFELVVSAHTLAETYSVLTRLPVNPKITAQAAWQFIEQNILSCVKVIALAADDYRDLIGQAVQNGLVGGVIYDAVIAKGAELATVDYLLTLNVGHFQRVWPHGASRVVSPLAMTPP
jgi:predicted nucleic acid-binding protein